VSVVVTGSITVIGTTTAGILQIFDFYVYEQALDSGVSSYIRAAGAFNLIAAIFGIIMIMSTLCTCLGSDENWSFCKPDCSIGRIILLIYTMFLLIGILITAILTALYLIPNYIGNELTDKAAFAILTSSGAASSLLVGFCIVGPFLCCSCGCRLKDITFLRMVGGLWALFTSGTVIAGGLMMKIGQSFATEKELKPDVPLDRESISAMGYFIGGLNFSIVAIATLFCIVVFCIRPRGHTYNSISVV
jgi:hypothetical protein